MIHLDRGEQELARAALEKAVVPEADYPGLPTAKQTLSSF